MKNNIKILKEQIKEVIRNLFREATPVQPTPPNQPQQPTQPVTPQPVQQPLHPQQPQPQDPNPNPDVVKQGVVTSEQAAALIRGTKGKIFTCIFIKRSDGQRRTLNGRLAVKAYLHGGVLPYNPNEKNLIPVFDIQKREYRMIPIDGIEELKINNYVFKVQK